VREEEWLVRFEPKPPRLIGEDPVPVVIEDEEVVREETPATAAALLPGAFASAWPQASQ
jgi:hypothetical protein